MEHKANVELHAFIDWLYDQLPKDIMTILEIHASHPEPYYANAKRMALETFLDRAKWRALDDIGAP